MYLSNCKIENEAILRDFLNFLDLTISEAQQFCETSLIFNEEILRDFLKFRRLTASKTKQTCEASFKNGMLSAALLASYQCVCDFSTPSV